MPRRSAPLRGSSILLTAILLVGACGQASTMSSPTGPRPSAIAGATAAPAITRSPDGSSPTPAAPPVEATPGANPAGGALGGKRINVLFVGLDNTTDRRPSALTDTVIVASLDPVGETVSLLGLPRDLSDFPLPDGSTYRRKLNALYADIRRSPATFGGARGADPYEILAGVVGTMVGLEIPHYAVVDMDGFAGLIDALGGVDVYVEAAICDPNYRQLGVRGFEAPPGWWRMTGPQALALARVRKNAGGSDFYRMRRQQDLLVAVRDAVVREGGQRNPIAWLAKVPQVKTNLPPALLVEMAAMVADLPFDAIRSRLIQPFGRGGTEIYDGRGYVLSANIDEIQDAAKRLFTQPGRTPSTGRQEPPPERPAKAGPLPRYNGC